MRQPLLALTILIGLWPPFLPAGDKKTAPEPKRKPRFTIGKETTLVTGPKTEDGFIDYMSALNERMGKGVTPKNNANVLLWRAMGPKPEGGRMPAVFFKWLEIDEPADKGDYFIDLARYMRDVLKIDPGKLDDQLAKDQERATARPWREKDFTHIAAWLKANEKPLALAVEASQRSEYFSPLASGSKEPGTLIAALLPGVQKTRSLANALCIRAMLHLGEGRADEAWRDVMACHRLGRLMTRGGTMIEELVGIAIEAMATNTALVFIDHAKADVKKLKDCLREVDALPALSPTADKVALAERFMLLDIIMAVNKHGAKYLAGLGGAGDGFLEMLPQEVLNDVDWDPALKLANQFYDRFATAMRVEDRVKREKELDAVDRDVKAIRVRLLDGAEILKALGDKTTPEVRGKAVGELLLTIMMPAVRKVRQAEDRAEQFNRNLRVALALAAHKVETGRYPEKLEALTPKYLPKIPQDVFSGKELIYRTGEKGYLLYSVGANGMDDGGRWFEDDPPGDDVRVRMPLPSKP